MFFYLVLYTGCLDEMLLLFILFNLNDWSKCPTLFKMHLSSCVLCLYFLPVMDLLYYLYFLDLLLCLMSQVDIYRLRLQLELIILGLACFLPLPGDVLRFHHIALLEGDVVGCGEATAIQALRASNFSFPHYHSVIDLSMSL